MSSVPQPKQPPPRWRPAVILVGLGLAVLVWIQLTLQADRQERYLRSFLTCLVTALLLLVWCLAFSRLRWRVRLGALGAAAAGVALAAALVRIEGVSGDLVPVFRWRWADTAQAAARKPAPGKPPAQSTNQVAAGWPQFLGPERNGQLPGPKLARDWSQRPPVELWRIPVGPAWSGFAIAAGGAVTQEQDGSKEVVTAYDAATGRLLWRHADEARYATTIAGEGPRATPTVAEGRVFTCGGTGLLNCLDLRTGTVIWSRDVLKENGGSVPEWGYSASPLVLENVVVVPAGGASGRSLVAYRKDTGQPVWNGGDDPLGYSSPVRLTVAGTPMLVIFNGRAVAGHNPADGRLLWRQAWNTPHPHVANPVPTGPDALVASAGYGLGAEAIRLTTDTNGQWAASRLWKTTRFKAKFSNFIVRGGYLYGLDDGILLCLEAATGELRWKDGRYGHGQFILVGSLLLLLAENGELVLVEPAPDARHELTRFRVFNAKTWNSPALAGDLAYLRNDREAVCLRLPVE